MSMALGRSSSPWRWAESLDACWLFWAPVAAGQMLDAQKEWLLEFFSQLEARVTKLSEFRVEHFMQSKTIDADPKLRDIFFNTMLKQGPLTGISHYPGQPKNPVPSVPSVKEAEAFAAGKQEFRPRDYMPDLAYWFTRGDGAQLRSAYLGYGGMTTLFVKPEDGGSPVPSPGFDGPVVVPKFLRNDARMKMLLEGFDPKQPMKTPAFLSKHPQMQKLFSTFGTENFQDGPARLQSGFLAKSKEVFGGDMEHDIVFDARPFVLPRLTSAHFFSQTAEQVRRWFEVFDIYVAESPVDGGIIIACKDNLKSLIAEIVAEMRDDRYIYFES